MKFYITTFVAGNWGFSSLDNAIKHISSGVGDVELIVVNNPGGDISEYKKLTSAIDQLLLNHKVSIRFCGEIGSCASFLLGYSFANNSKNFSFDYAECTRIDFHKPRLVISGAIKNTVEDDKYINDLVSDYRSMKQDDAIYCQQFYDVVEYFHGSQSAELAKTLFNSTNEDFTYSIEP
ncbi:TPA: hypothetical protein ACQYCS_004734 [Vibrio parahaemolyticus]|uniref:hypothetical protein n=1 Tax=Vibrio parahaemolyticus TaxID=670 RepID=UPI00111E777C|nr:hypothetical protein [Vibrio parahaemolyticus]EGQ8195819.1 hypothetical protein [Vibrio parahaemolyticus]TOB19277.1 hypothetical protein CGK11_23385 [Vibrio parahaemolyticus]